MRARTKFQRIFRSCLVGLILLLVLTIAISLTVLLSQYRQEIRGKVSISTAFVASIDTMKESKDTESSAQLTNAQIANDVNLCASLNTNYITVDTHYDYDMYMARWVQAIRVTGRHVWFRPGWVGLGTGANGIITPTMYLNKLRTFILTHADLFQPGDIFDEDAEPENGKYWGATYGSDWSSHAPNKATDDFNNFLVALTDTADQAFQQLGVRGVITTVHSIDPWTAEHSQVLYPGTVQRMGNLVTVDAYPDANTTDPASAANAWLQQLMKIHAAHPTARILIGEMGYSNNLPVNDTTQEAILKAELNALSSVPYLVGINYWVGAGTNNSGGYTHIFTGNTGNWSLRPAAYDLAAFYNRKAQKS